jgi:chloramphenicol-sensitive protein RarD
MMEQRSGAAPNPAREHALGLLYASAAYVVWGLGPIFWKAVDRVPASELLAYRTIFSAAIMAVALSATQQWLPTLRLLQGREARGALLCSTALLGANWFTFIWAVNSGQVLQASLGYFINPLFSVLLGVVFLAERLRPVQLLSVALAGTGVLIQVIRVGEVPWLGLVLALTFGLYGLIRKRAAAGPEQGLAVETTLLSPLVGLYLWSQYHAGAGALGRVDLRTDLLLVCTGPITILPLIWFTHGARRLPLGTIGILQYIAPTSQFLLAVAVYHEPFETPHIVSFAFVWAALALFTVESHFHRRRS